MVQLEVNPLQYGANFPKNQLTAKDRTYSIKNLNPRTNSKKSTKLGENLGKGGEFLGSLLEIQLGCTL